MSTVVDILALARLVQDWLSQAAKYTALIVKMRTEGRDTLTDEELADLQADDDAARQRLVDAIQNSPP